MEERYQLSIGNPQSLQELNFREARHARGQGVGLVIEEWKLTASTPSPAAGRVFLGKEIRAWFSVETGRERHPS